ncbi:U6 snRNA-associated sm-like protein Lsm3 [Babesia caballi]|uniref:U6 snRNA-associated sm-like protein Lsm3 n=1 Tax=Babesia caballi TaxID=5871 RepID=A0AAV4LVC1_BABCB|nr:U6 snRNA-associated sm-like protein Lsm3 [Babesia caballi]
MDMIRINLDENVYIKCKGGREIIGKLHAYDEHCNMVLSEAKETITAVETDPQTKEESTKVVHYAAGSSRADHHSKQRHRLRQGRLADHAIARAGDHVLVADDEQLLPKAKGGPPAEGEVHVVVKVLGRSLQLGAASRRDTAEDGTALAEGAADHGATGAVMRWRSVVRPEGADAARENAGRLNGRAAAGSLREGVARGAGGTAPAATEAVPGAAQRDGRAELNRGRARESGAGNVIEERPRGRRRVEQSGEQEELGDANEADARQRARKHVVEDRVAAVAEANVDGAQQEEGGDRHRRDVEVRHKVSHLAYGDEDAEQVVQRVLVRETKVDAAGVDDWSHDGGQLLGAVGGRLEVAGHVAVAGRLRRERRLQVVDQTKPALDDIRIHHILRLPERGRTIHTARHTRRRPGRCGQGDAMCALLASGVRLSRLYNPRFRAKEGFFDTSHRPAPLAKLPTAGGSGRRITLPACGNYAHHVASEREKPEDLAQTVAKVLAERVGSKVCVYASQRNAKQALQCSSIGSRRGSRSGRSCCGASGATASRAEHLAFRRGNFAILLTDGVTGMLPVPDVVVHYDLPKSPEALKRRQRPQRANVFFYLSHERVLVAHLQHALNAVVEKWELPSRTQQAEAFLDKFGEVEGVQPLPPGVGIEGGSHGDHEMLGALMYFVHRKHAHSKKQYLLHDPGFQRFRTRRDVEQYLSEKGVTNYTGIALSRRGFVVESYEMLRLPVVHEAAAELPGLRRIRRRVSAGCISSSAGKKRAFEILAKDHERKMIRAFRFKQARQPEAQHVLRHALEAAGPQPELLADALEVDEVSAAHAKVPVQKAHVGRGAVGYLQAVQGRRRKLEAARLTHLQDVGVAEHRGDCVGQVADLVHEVHQANVGAGYLHDRRARALAAQPLRRAVVVGDVFEVEADAACIGYVDAARRTYGS